MTGTIKIVNSCKISGGKAWLEDRLILEQEEGNSQVFFNALYKTLSVNYPKWYKMDRLSQLGILATELLFRDHPFSAKEAPYETAIVLANKEASLDTDARFVEQLDEIPSPAVFVYTLPNIVLGEISIRYGIKGEQAFFLMEKPDPDFIQHYVETIFAEKQVKHCITGWLDCFREDYQAVLFHLTIEPDGYRGKEFNSNNLYQYIS